MSLRTVRVKAKCGYLEEIEFTVDYPPRVT